jgi:hypothetical protein
MSILQPQSSVTIRVGKALTCGIYRAKGRAKGIAKRKEASRVRYLYVPDKLPCLMCPSALSPRVLNNAARPAALNEVHRRNNIQGQI